MTTSDPILYPMPIGNVESRRQAVTRARADLVTTLHALSERIDPRRADPRQAIQQRVTGVWQAALPVLGACAAGTIALVATRRHWGGRSPLTADRGGKLAAGAVVLAASTATYAALGRGDRPTPPTALPGTSRSALRDETSRGGTAHSGNGRNGNGRNGNGRNGNGRNGNGRNGIERDGAGVDSAGRRSPVGAPGAAVALRSNVDSGAGMDSGGGSDSGAVLGRSPAGGDVVDVLLEQHRRTDTFFTQVMASAGPQRRDTFAMLVDFLKRHENAEQEIVHPALRALGDSHAHIVDGRLDEEKNADRQIASLISRGTDDPEFLAGLAELRDMVHAHAAHEEAEEFPLLRARIPTRQLQSMAKRVRSLQIGGFV